MFVIVWRYVVRPERVDEFVAAYAPGGAWAELFGRSPEFLGVELIAADEVGAYVTIDRWATDAAFAAFMADFGDEYRDLDRRFEALTVSEDLIARGWSIDDGS